MSTDLYRVSKACWAVKSSKLPEIAAFETIEEAATLLEELGIAPDEVDVAIMEMTGQGHSHAQFGVGATERGPMFIYSDNEVPGFSVGVA